jgi:hypothetical protein
MFAERVDKAYGLRRKPGDEEPTVRTTLTHRRRKKVATQNRFESTTPDGRDGRAIDTTKIGGIDALIARAESLCRQVAPCDLGDAPLYILPQTGVPANCGGRSTADGFTAPSLDLYLRDVIGPAWRGRGPCMVVNDIDLSDGQPDPIDIESAFCGIVLHELAHILLRPAPFKPRPDAEPAKIAFESLVVGHAVATEPPADAQVEPFAGHEADFIRVALHLRHRADLAGTLVPMFYYCAGTFYGLSHPNRYREALGDEPDRMAGLSIREILATPCPETFWHQWTIDVAR